MDPYQSFVDHLIVEFVLQLLLNLKVILINFLQDVFLLAFALQAYPSLLRFEQLCIIVDRKLFAELILAVVDILDNFDWELIDVFSLLLFVVGILIGVEGGIALGYHSCT